MLRAQGEGVEQVLDLPHPHLQPDRVLALHERLQRLEVRVSVLHSRQVHEQNVLRPIALGANRLPVVGEGHPARLDVPSVPPLHLHHLGHLDDRQVQDGQVEKGPGVHRHYRDVQEVLPGALRLGDEILPFRLPLETERHQLPAAVQADVRAVLVVHPGHRTADQDLRHDASGAAVLAAHHLLVHLTPGRGSSPSP
ncbi:hypothetical protein DSECCO2_495240 [anaerobic digester metagenome]